MTPDFDPPGKPTDTAFGPVGPVPMHFLAARAVQVVPFRDWQKIEAAALARARSGAPRETFSTIPDMLAMRDQARPRKTRRRHF